MNDLTHRDVVIGTAPAGVALVGQPLPAWAATARQWPHEPKDHPFLAIQTWDEPAVHALTVYWETVPVKPEDHLFYGWPGFDPSTAPTTRQQTAFQVTKLAPEVPVSSLAEAEDLAIRRMVAEAGSVYKWDRAKAVSPLWTINQASAAVAFGSRRGWATAILVHPDSLPIITRPAPAWSSAGPSIARPLPNPEPVRFGRWTRLGHYGKGQTVYTGPVPLGVALVLYKGSQIEAPAFYSETPAGRHLTWRPRTIRKHGTQEEVQVMGDPMDFVQIVHLTGDAQ